MKSRLTILALLLGFSSSVFADEWRVEDTYRQTITSVLIAVDWNQTLQIADECRFDIRHERNPILGKCPTHGEVNAYFATYLISNYLIARALPKDYRSAFQYIYIGHQAHTVNHNISVGLHFKF